MKQLFSLAMGISIGLLGLPMAAWGQSITAAEDGTGTVVDVSGNQYDISGGTQADANLFHSFEQLGLSEGEIANFLAGSDVENILGRVTGGDASFINGLLQVSGADANLFLMNPAGVIFGENAQLNVPADFSVTTANAIRIDEDWFRAIGTNDYRALTGIPESFAFATEAPGAIVNDGDLSVGEGQRIQLVGGLVVNTGTISTPGGEITVEAVPGEGVVTVTQEGNLLSLGLPVDTEAAIGGNQDFVSPQTVPQLLSNAAANVNGIVAEGDVVRLTQVDRVIPTDVGTAIVSGTLDVSSDDAIGGRVDVLGEKVALVGAQVQASGAEGGGSIRVGGEYRGEGSLPNAVRVYVDSESSILASAVDAGDGGRVILWSDEATQFYGDVEATGGEQAGDGGFVEISSQDNLVFVGDVNVEALNGEGGTLLLDPRTIRIIDGADGSGDLDNELTDDDEILTGLPNQEETTLSVSRLESFSGSSLLIEADDGITVGPISDNQLNLSIGTVTFIADGDDDAVGDFIVEGQQRATIETDGRLEISAASVLVGDIDSNFGVDILSEQGDVETQSISSRRGKIELKALQGNVIVETITNSASYVLDEDSRDSIIVIEARGVFQANGVLEFPRNDRNSFSPESIDIDENSLLKEFLKDEGVLDENGEVIPSDERLSESAQQISVRTDPNTSRRTVDVIDRFPVSIGVSLTDPPSDGNPYISIQHGGVSLSDLGSSIEIIGDGDIPFSIGPTKTENSFEIVEFENANGVNLTNVARVLNPLSFSEDDLISGTAGAIFGDIEVPDGSNQGSTFSLRNRPFVPTITVIDLPRTVFALINRPLTSDRSDQQTTLPYLICEESIEGNDVDTEESLSFLAEADCVHSELDEERILEISRDLIDD